MPKRKTYKIFLSLEDRIDADLEFDKDPGGNPDSSGSRLHPLPESRAVGERSSGMTTSTATSIANGFGARASRAVVGTGATPDFRICWTPVARISRATGRGTGH